MRPWRAMAMALVLASAACGTLRQGPEGTGGCPPDDPGCIPITAGATGTCLAGDPDCPDVPGTTGPPADPPLSGAVPVAQALAAGIDGPFAISGYYVDDGSGPRICEALAESYPPQCGGPSIAFDGGGSAIGGLRTDQGVTWSDDPVEVQGEIAGGVFRALVAE